MLSVMVGGRENEGVDIWEEDMEALRNVQSRYKGVKLNNKLWNGLAGI